jgi:hypothetical protein
MLRLLCLLVLSSYALAWKRPPVCNGTIACCMETLCVDCECQDCIEHGGVPAGPNTTCENDRCVCCEEPPICTEENFCHTVFEFCCEFEPCNDWLSNFKDRLDFCDCLDDVLHEACLRVEHICESETTMGVFVGMVSRAPQHHSIAPDVFETPGSGLLIYQVLLAIMFLLFCLAMGAFCCIE